MLGTTASRTFEVGQTSRHTPVSARRWTSAGPLHGAHAVLDAAAPRSRGRRRCSGPGELAGVGGGEEAGVAGDGRRPRRTARGPEQLVVGQTERRPRPVGVAGGEREPARRHRTDRGCGRPAPSSRSRRRCRREAGPVTRRAAARAVLVRRTEALTVVGQVDGRFDVHRPAGHGVVDRLVDQADHVVGPRSTSHAARYISAKTVKLPNPLTTGTACRARRPARPAWPAACHPRGGGEGEPWAGTSGRSRARLEGVGTPPVARR